MKKIIHSTNAPNPIGPYSQAILVDSMLYVSGQVGIDAQTGKLNNTDIRTETHQVLKNIGEILKATGMSFVNVIKCTIFLKDMNDFATINTIYGEYFTKDFPARETVEVSQLPASARIEISCIASL